MKLKKQKKRLLSLALVSMLLLSFFAVSVSAFSMDADPCCGPYNLQDSFNKDRIQGKYGMVYCSECDSVWGYIDYSDIDEILTDPDWFLSEGYFSEHDGGVYFDVSLIRYDENGDMEVYSNSLPVISRLPAPEGPVIDNSGMAGEMVGAITGAVGGILAGVGSTIVEFFDSTVLDDNGNLTTFAKAVLAMLGIGFSLSIVYVVNRFVDRRR